MCLCVEVALLLIAPKKKGVFNAINCISLISISSPSDSQPPLDISRLWSILVDAGRRGLTKVDPDRSWSTQVDSGIHLLFLGDPGRSYANGIHPRSTQERRPGRNIPDTTRNDKHRTVSTCVGPASEAVPTQFRCDTVQVQMRLWGDNGSEQPGGSRNCRHNMNASSVAVLAQAYIA